MFAATSIGFIIATINTTTEIAGFDIFIRVGLIDNIGLPPSTSRNNAALVKPDIVLQWTSNLMVGLF